MNKGFFADILAHKPVLLQMMLVSNVPPLPEKTPLALAELLAAHGLNPGLWADARARHALAEPAQTFWDYGEESSRLALLDSAHLFSLAQYVGTAIHAPSIAKLIARDAILNFRAELGDSLYEYAISRGQYQLGTSRNAFLPLDPELDLPQRVRRHGLLVLECCATRWPNFLREKTLAPLRPLLTEGKALSTEQVDALHVEADRVRTLWFAVKKLLLKEVAPQWAPCFD